MNKEQLEYGDILESIHDSSRIAYVKDLTDYGVIVSIDKEKNLILNEQLHHWKLANPIINNRLVNDKTFAVRFKQFLEWIPEEWWKSQPHYLEEYEYMKRIATRLIKYQIETVTDKSEIDYLKNLNLYDY